MSGWVKLHRQLQESPLWTSEPFSRGQAWMDLVMLANYKDGYVRSRGRRIEVPVGSVARSQCTFSERWKWSRGKVIRFFKELEKDGQIKQKTSHDFNVISICNYKQYQERESRDGTRDRSRDRTRHESRDGPLPVHETGHETVHIKESKEREEGKEGKKNNPPKKFDGDGLPEVVISLPTKGGGVHDVTAQTMERYRENFPTLDVMAQLRAIRQHLEDHAHKRVPEWNTATFILSWLNNRVGDKGRASQAQKNQPRLPAERYAIDDTARKFNIAGVSE